MIILIIYRWITTNSFYIFCTPNHHKYIWFFTNWTERASHGAYEKSNDRPINKIAKQFTIVQLTQDTTPTTITVILDRLTIRSDVGRASVETFRRCVTSSAVRQFVYENCVCGLAQSKHIFRWSNFLRSIYDKLSNLQFIPWRYSSSFISRRSNVDV